MANAILFMFVHVHMYILGLTNQKYIMHTYIAYAQKAKFMKTDRQSNRDGTKEFP